MVLVQLLRLVQHQDIAAKYGRRVKGNSLSSEEHVSPLLETRSKRIELEGRCDVYRDGVVMAILV